MTAIADATTAELADNDLVAVPRDEWDAMQDRIDDLETIVHEQREELAEHQDHVGREFADVRSRITDTEGDIEDLEARNQQTEAHSGDATPRVEGSETGAPAGETPLYRICALPEEMAARELTANQERARFIARDARDYAEKCPAGLVIDSRAIKRVITAKEGTKPHTQTVARVMNFLAELGKDSVEQKKRRGRKLVSFDPEVADRLTNASAANHTRGDQGTGARTPEPVISG
jgi:TolA-binding protein